MSVIRPQTKPIVQFYRSAPTPCPYLPGRIERKLFTRLPTAQATDLNSELTRAGFRRSHDIVYRPICPDCSACRPVRIPVTRFRPSRTQKRLAKRNADLTATLCEPTPTEEQYQLFMRYQNSRHSGSDMAEMSRADYQAMVAEGGASCAIVEFRLPDDQLVGCVLIDCLSDGVSAVYSFYDPDLARRSLGTTMILAVIGLVQESQLAHVYLGYWIRESSKMAYKSQFRPLEALGPQGWRVLTETETTP